MTLKEPSPNDLIINLFDKFNSYTDRFKERIKIDSIFSEFDENSRKNLNKFVELSQLRYKRIKSGNSLDYLLLKQKPKYNQLSNNILNDQYFLSKEIDNENKKLLKKFNKKENNEIMKIRKEIIEKTKDLTNNEKKLRDELQEKLRKKMNFNKTYQEKFYRPFSQVKKKKNNNENFENDNLSENKELSPQNLLDNIMDEDSKLLNNTIDDYKKVLEKINDNKTMNQKLLKEINSISKYNLNLLSFSEKKIKNIHPIKKEEKGIDIKLLMKYTKRGKSACKFYNKYFNQTNKSFNNNKFETKNQLFKTKDSYFKVKNYLTPSLSTSSLFFENNNNDNLTINNNSNSKIDLLIDNNTKNLVKNEAEKIKFIEENIDKKTNNIELLFNKLNCPNFKKKKAKSALNIKKEKKIEKNILNVPNKKDKFSLLLEFNKVYEKKKKEWELEDERIKLEKKKENEIIKNTKNYLMEIQSLKRKPQLYIDLYSKRDGITNKRIEEFNKTLNRTFFNKKHLRKKLDDFNEKIELEEIEKKIYESQLEKDYFEKKKTKENDLEKKMIEKLRKNLKYTIENNDIDFSYRVIGQKIKVENKNDPYQEYLNFFKDVINKKELNYIEYKKPINIQTLNKSHSQLNIKKNYQFEKDLFKNKKEKNENTKIIIMENID